MATNEPLDGSMSKSGGKTIALDQRQCEALWDLFGDLKSMENVDVRVQRGGSVLHINVAKGSTWKL